MPPQVSKPQLSLVQEQLIAAFMALLDDAAPLEDPAELEQLAGTALVGLEQPGLPAHVVCAVLEAIEARRDPAAAGMLAALAVLAVEPLATRARAGGERLAAQCIASPAAAGLGTLAVVEAVRVEGGGVELLVATLRRPGTDAVQAAILGVEHERSGGALVLCGLAPAAPFKHARDLLDGVGCASAPEPVTADELAARALAAARRSIEQEIALGHESGPAWPIVSRALTGDPAGLPRPAVEAPGQDDDTELVVDAVEDEAGFQRVMELLLDELEAHARATYPPGDVVWQHGDFVASTMLQWKGDYGDGRLGRWTREDLAEYLLDYFPRKVTVYEETLDAVPDCVRAFLGFLEARGSLSGDPLEQLEHALGEFSDEFHERAGAPSHWGLAKSMTMQMIAEGVDPAEPGALETWMADFNARPRPVREALLAPAAHRMMDGAGRRPPTKSHTSQQQRAGQRKAQRSARKRNRRR
jgi:hypothetical protein